VTRWAYLTYGPDAANVLFPCGERPALEKAAHDLDHEEAHDGMGEGFTRRRYGGSHPRSGPRVRMFHPPRRTLRENPSSQPRRKLAGEHKTTQIFWNPHAPRLVFAPHPLTVERSPSSLLFFSHPCAIQGVFPQFSQPSCPTRHSALSPLVSRLDAKGSDQNVLAHEHEVTRLRRFIDLTQ
jgi:hypothetical protein